MSCDPHNTTSAGFAKYPTLVSSPTINASIDSGRGSDLNYNDKGTVSFATLSSYARAMIELQDDVKLKNTIVVVVPKLVGEVFSMCTICIEYEWKPTRRSSCKVFGHVQDECPKKIILDVLINLKNPRQAVRGVQVGLKLGFKQTKQVYQPVSKKKGASASGIMASMSHKVNNNSKSGSGVGNKSLYKQWRKIYIKDSYDDDDFDDCGLNTTQLKLANAFDIRVRGQV
ncbi:hypothetical protein Tco_1473628 [Tanacetum coccineum]